MLEYDNYAFFYFTLTLITFYLVPVTLGVLFQIFRAIVPHNDAWLRARTADEKEKLTHLRKESSGLKVLFTSWWFLTKVASLVIGWAIFFALLSTMGGESAGLAQFDPYAILGIDMGAESKEIKRAYRSLSLQYHPDKNPGNKMAEDMFMKIAKAYEALTDAQSKENWEKYGNPDGKQPMAVSIALPTFLLDKDYHNSILIVYLLAMVIVIPSIVAMWYASSKKYGEKNVMYDTYTWYNHMLQEQTRIQQIAEILAGSAEFRVLNKPKKVEEPELQRLLKEMASNPQEVGIPRLRYNHPIIVKGTVLLFAHVTRRPLSPGLQKCLDAMLVATPDLIEAMVELCCSRRWLGTTLAVLDFSQHMVQGLWNKDNHLKQLPHIGETEIKQITTGKDAPKNLKQFLDFEAEAAAPAEPVTQLTDGSEADTKEDTTATATTTGAAADAAKDTKDAVVAVPPTALTRRRSSLAVVPEQQRGEVVEALKAIPAVTMEVTTFVEDEEEIAEGDLVTIKIKITRNNVAEGERCPPVYAPRFPAAREEGWWVLLCSGRNNQILSYGHVVATERVCEKELKLMAPNRASTVSLEVVIKSDSYLGLDEKHDISFEVVSASTLPVYEPHPDDLELDNEPTLFEQVMQGDSDSDSDDEDETKDAAGNALTNGAAKSAGEGSESGSQGDDEEDEITDED